MSSGPKIIIKPRQSARFAANAPKRAPSARTESPDESAMEVDVVADDAQSGDASPHASSSTQQGPDAPPTGEADGDGSEVADGDYTEDVEEPPPEPEERPKRGRGRPRGSGTPRPRGRPRGSGRGRGRGRGRAITIRLPGRTNEESGGGADGDGTEGEEGVATPASGDDTALGKQIRKVNGRTYVIEGDELQIDDDPKGDTKIDKWGNLLEGRVFKAATFKLPNRHPERIYMLAIDAARTSGFRDSLYYFRRNPLAFKLNATQPEKDHLIEQGKLGGHLRTRAVTLITARSAYKLHGSKTVQDGRWVIDDYYEDRVLEEITAKGLKPGDPVGDLQDPRAPKELDVGLDFGPQGARGADRGAGGLGMYRAGGPTTIFGGAGFGPFSEGPLNAPKKAFYSREGVTEENWMLEAAQRTLAASDDWSHSRREGLKICGGVFGDTSRKDNGSEDAEELERRRKLEEGFPKGAYEAHTGIVLYRDDTQPTQSRWEKQPDTADKRSVLGGTKVGRNAWGLAWVDVAMELSSPSMTETHHQLDYLPPSGLTLYY